jgi:regulator of protease activity HflC (stomatin/prohibitin superfamily)
VGRGATVNYEAKALYTSSREMIGDKIKTDLTKLLDERGLVVENVLLRSITLPTMVSNAIELKLKAEQESEQMKFILDKERQEADRKRIEAEGIRNFQRIVNEGLTKDYLTWKGVEATEKLSQSGNSKIVIIGNSKNGLPVILSGEGK